MNKTFFWGALFIVLLQLFLPSTGQASGYIEGEALVMLEAPPGAAAKDVSAFEAQLSASAARLAASAGASVESTFSAIAARSGKNIVHLRSGRKKTEQLIADLEKLPGVLGAWPNFVVEAARTPDDPGYPRLWGMQAIGAPGAWERNTGSEEIFVAVIDTGIDYNHEDLAANMGRDLDGNFGIDTVNKDNDPMDDEGHGTHVAGTIGAVGNNGIGVTGVNWRVSMLAVKVLGSDAKGSESQIIRGLNYVLDQKGRGLNIRVVNMSLTGWRNPIPNPERHPYGVAHKAVSDAGIVIVVAAGNEKQDIDAPDKYYDFKKWEWVDLRGRRPYPAAFSFRNMITVASISGDRDLSSFTNFSPNFVHIAAPGSKVYSTSPGNGYREDQGTSMAAPHVAGAAALIAAEHPGKSAPEIKALILGNTTQNYRLQGRVISGGFLNLESALKASPTEVPVTAISVFPKTVNLVGKTSYSVTARIEPANADDKRIVWFSDNPTVATVEASENGATIYSVSDGKAKVTAQALDGLVSATVAVSVGGAGGFDHGGGGCSVGGASAGGPLLLAALLALLLKR